MAGVSSRAEHSDSDMNGLDAWLASAPHRVTPSAAHFAAHGASGSAHPRPSSLPGLEFRSNDGDAASRAKDSLVKREAAHSEVPANDSTQPAAQTQACEEFYAGDPVQFFSRSKRRWVNGTVLGRNQNGTYNLTVKHYAAVGLIRRQQIAIGGETAEADGTKQDGVEDRGESQSKGESDCEAEENAIPRGSSEDPQQSIEDQPSAPRDRPWNRVPSDRSVSARRSRDTSRSSQRCEFRPGVKDWSADAREGSTSPRHETRQRSASREFAHRASEHGSGPSCGEVSGASRESSRSLGTRETRQGKQPYSSGGVTLLSRDAAKKRHRYCLPLRPKEALRRASRQHAHQPKNQRKSGRAHKEERPSSGQRTRPEYTEERPSSRDRRRRASDRKSSARSDDSHALRAKRRRRHRMSQQIAMMPIFFPFAAPAAPAAPCPPALEGTLQQIVVKEMPTQADFQIAEKLATATRSCISKFVPEAKVDGFPNGNMGMLYENGVRPEVDVVVSAHPEVFTTRLGDYFRRGQGKATKAKSLDTLRPEVLLKTATKFLSSQVNFGRYWRTQLNGPEVLIALLIPETYQFSAYPICMNLAVNAVHISRLSMLLTAGPWLRSGLILCVLRWARERAVGNPARGQLSKYAWALLVCHFYQHRATMVPGGPMTYCDLLRQFLDCCGDAFQVGARSVVISFSGMYMTPPPEKSSLGLPVVEDIYEPGVDVAAHVSVEGITRMVEELRRARVLLARGAEPGEFFARWSPPK